MSCSEAEVRLENRNDAAVLCFPHLRFENVTPYLSVSN